MKRAFVRALFRLGLLIRGFSLYVRGASRTLIGRFRFVVFFLVLAVATGDAWPVWRLFSGNVYVWFDGAVRDRFLDAEGIAGEVLYGDGFVERQV